MSRKVSLLCVLDAIDRARENPSELRRLAVNLAKMVYAPPTGGGYVVVSSFMAEKALYGGDRNACLAFKEGYEAAPQRYSDVAEELFVCVDTPSRMIVFPDDKFGETLLIRQIETKGE